MKESYLPAGAMIVGLVLILCGYLQEHILSTNGGWTDEKAIAHGKNAAQMHNAAYSGHDHSKENAHGEPDRKSEEYLKAKAEFEKSKADLESAHSRQTWMKYGIVLTGVAITGFGIVRVAIDKMRADEATTLRRSGR
jgi:hypothetical protein